MANFHKVLETLEEGKMSHSGFKKGDDLAIDKAGLNKWGREINKENKTTKKLFAKGYYTYLDVTERIWWPAKVVKVSPQGLLTVRWINGEVSFDIPGYVFKKASNRR